MVGFGLLESFLVVSCIAVLVSVDSLSLIHLVQLVLILKKSAEVLLMEMGKYLCSDPEVEGYVGMPRTNSRASPMIPHVLVNLHIKHYQNNTLYDYMAPAF